MNIFNPDRSLDTVQHRVLQFPRRGFAGHCVPVVLALLVGHLGADGVHGCFCGLFLEDAEEGDGAGV